jgi:hypothetical protein
MMTGDYVLSFNEQTRTLRQPFSLPDVFRRMLDCLPEPHDNSLRNQSTNQDVRNFVAERQHTDLLFLRLPVPVTQTTTFKDPIVTWREEWLRGGDEFWLEFERERGAGSVHECKANSSISGLLKISCAPHRTFPPGLSHTPRMDLSPTKNWLRKIGRVRKVSSIYSKDFSDMLGVRASLIVANS